MFLSDDEVVTLTGYSQPEKQSEWLCDNRILHFRNHKNRVIATWESVNKPLYLQSEEPNFDQVS